MRTAIFGMILFASASFAPATTFEARSAHHVMTIDVQPLSGDDVDYNVRVTSLESNAVLLSQHVTRKIGFPADLSNDVGDLHVVVHLSPGKQALSANLEIEQGELLVDSIRIGWILAPRHAHVHAPGAMRVGGDVRAPIVMHRVEPQYTEKARKDRVSGVVIVEVLIDKTGIVREAVVLEELPDGLSGSAVAAVKQWVFQPGTFSGQPVDVIFNLVINFKIDTPPADR